MCGIVAFFSYASAEPVDPARIVRVRDAMVARGPDGAGIWISPDRRVGLAHRRLAIIDPSPAGAQPMVSADGTLAIVFSGEIYNHRELRADLERDGRRFRSTSDTEVLLALYERRGVAMLGELRGMYAFAIWDGRRRELLLARDPFGIKPLYFADDGRTISVASQVKALIAGGGLDTSPEPAGHTGFLLWGHVPEPYTLFRGIRSLEAGCSLVVTDSGPGRRRRHVDLKGLLALPGPRAQGRSARLEVLRDALLDTVRHHLVADVPVGIFLSAGLDSSTILALASEVHAAGLRSVTLGVREYEGGPNDETPLAGLVARRYGADPATRWISARECRRELERILAAMDQPTIDGINVYFAAKAARETGLKVALSGVGGDELFGGYPSFRQIPALVGAMRPATMVPGLGRIFRLLSPRALFSRISPKYAGLFEYGGSYEGAYLLRRGLYMPWELPGLLDGEMVKEGWAELQPLLRLGDSIAGVTGARRRISLLEISWYLRNQLLRDADWAGMAHSLEIRTPLVDIRLLQAVAGIGAPGPRKGDLALVPANPLPREVLARGKTGFQLPLREWLTADDASLAGERGLRGWALRVYAAARPKVNG